MVNAVFARALRRLRRRCVAASRGGARRADARATSVELLLTSTVEAGRTREALAVRIADGLPPAPLWRQAEARLLAQRVAELVRDGHARAGEIVVLLRAVGRSRRVRARAAAARPAHARVRRRLLGPPAGRRSARLPARARQPARRGGALRDARLARSPASRATVSRCSRAPPASGRRGAWEAASRRGDASRAGLADTDEAAADGVLRAPADASAPARRGGPISQLLERAIDAPGIAGTCSGSTGGERRLANVHKLLRLARRFEAAEGRDLRGFLDHVGAPARRAERAEPDAPVDGVEPDAVRLMTIHAAKGLEFPVVCVADLGRAPNTGVRDLLVDGERVGLRLARLDGAEPTPDARLRAAVRRAPRRAKPQEEDRIVYVAMTRARERLMLSGAVDFDALARVAPGGQHDLLARARALTRAAQARLRPVRGRLAISTVGTARVRCLLNTPGERRRACCACEHRRRSGCAAGASVRRAQRAEMRRAAVAAAPTPSQALVAAEPRATTPATLSYTALSELERCGYRYYLERVLGLREDRSAARTQRAAREPGGARPRDARAQAVGVGRLRRSDAALTRRRREGRSRDGRCASDARSEGRSPR